MSIAQELLNSYESDESSPTIERSKVLAFVAKTKEVAPSLCAYLENTEEIDYNRLSASLHYDKLVEHVTEADIAFIKDFYELENYAWNTHRNPMPFLSQLAQAEVNLRS